MINLKDKKVIITGGTGGIGYSLVEKFVHAGANVLATGTNLEKIENLNKNFKNIKTLQFDISKHDEIETFVDNASSVLGGGIDILINNAGITRDTLSIRMKTEDWKKVIDVNLTSTFLISKNVIKKMLKNKSGKIINITSVVGHTGNIGQSNYTASKAAIVGMSKSLAIEFAKKNININCISPGFITTAMTDQIEEKFKEALKNKIPADRFGSPSDVANTAIFLASELADYITGETIHVNGGMYLG
ncbi:3-oxoacyl-ACP reductase FabG [Candidatus Pelagibacter sp.]|nr:3-oxoacyl-ACP reductase FabG [Candidatus Pelagibacter sp.]